MRDMGEARACEEALSASLDMKAIAGNGFTPLTLGIHGISDLSVAAAPVSDTSRDAEGGLGEKETKIDLDAAVRAVDVALAGLDLGSKRPPTGLPPSPNEQKRPQSTLGWGASSPQKFQGFKAAAPRRRVPAWPEDGPQLSRSESLKAPEQQLQLQIQRGFQEPRFRPAQHSPPAASNRSALRFLSPGSGVGGLAHAYTAPAFPSTGCFAPDGDSGVGGFSPVGMRSPVQGVAWDGLNGLSPQGAYADCLRAVLLQNKPASPYESKAVGFGTGNEFGAGSEILASVPPYRADSCPELLSASPPYTLAANVERSATSFGGLGCGRLELNQNHDIGLHNLPESLDLFDEEGLWQQPDFLPDVVPIGKAMDPKTKSEQAMLVAITGILKCAVEGNLTPKDVLSDLNFLIVTVRRHLAEYQALSNEAAETLQLICSTLPTVCKCARFSGDVIDSLKRFMQVICTGHPLLQAQGSCLNSYDPVDNFEPRQHSEVQHLLRRIHRKLTGGTTSKGVQHVAHALYDAVGDKCSLQSSSTGVDVESHGSSPKSFGQSLLASRSTVAGAQSPGFSDGDASSTTT
ncbi:unnamed protein product, partial [Ostreobium quekettii]